MRGAGDEVLNLLQRRARRELHGGARAAVEFPASATLQEVQDFVACSAHLPGAPAGLEARGSAFPGPCDGLAILMMCTIKLSPLNRLMVPFNRHH